MAAVIHCPSCSAPLAVTPEMTGKLIACPACDQRIQLGETVASAPAEERKPICSADSTSGSRNRLNSVPQKTALVAALSVLAGLVIAAGIVGWRAGMANRQRPDQAELPPSARIRPATGQAHSPSPEAAQPQDAVHPDRAIAAE